MTRFAFPLAIATMLAVALAAIAFATLELQALLVQVPHVH